MTIPNIKISWGGLLAALCLIYMAYALVWPRIESARWSDCIGRTIEDCRAPAQWGKIDKGCPKWYECSTSPPGVSYASSELLSMRGELLGSYAYAVLALDGERHVRKVEIRRIHPTP